MNIWHGIGRIKTIYSSPASSFCRKAAKSDGARSERHWKKLDECLAVPAKPDKRDLTAIKRLCTAFVKLLYPNAACKDDIPADEFVKYCLEPAKEMRGIIKKQLCMIDPKEFNALGKKDIPDIQYNYL